MLLIAGLGNPGEKYAHNRHNVGFMFIEYLFQHLEKNATKAMPWKFDKYANADIAKLETQDTLILAKPQTYMNRSGESIRLIAKNNELLIDQIIVAHDDLDIDIGKFKIQLGVGPKKHNGLSSIQDHLHTNDFWRIRIGVDNRKGDRSMSGEEYVLQNFSNAESDILHQIFPEIRSKLFVMLEENKK